MLFSVLGSGSRGNATVVCAGATRILVDAGLSGRELVRRLETLGVAPHEISAIVLTHEHGDHTRGAGVFARAHGTPVYMTAGTLGGCRKLFRGGETLRTYRAGHPLALGDLEVNPCATVHDAAEPVAIQVTHAAESLRLGIATDLGRPTVQVLHAMRGCHALVVESNHDEGLLWAARYPTTVKTRIASSHGHLSNQAAARFVVDACTPRLRVVVLAHLSEESNAPALALSVMRRALARTGFGGDVLVAESDEPTPMLDLAELRASSGSGQLSLFR